jgi:hypothetical protein
MKICTKCGAEKALTEFYRHCNAKDGYKSICKECINSKMFVYSRNRYSSKEGRAKQMFNSAKCRAKKRNIEFNLSFELVRSLVEIGHCPKTGFRFNLIVPDDTNIGPLAPSLDRKEASKGYTNENVQIVCNMYNMGKSDADELDFIAMCLAVAERNANNQAAIARLAELKNAGH